MVDVTLIFNVQLANDCLVAMSSSSPDENPANDAATGDFMQIMARRKEAFMSSIKNPNEKICPGQIHFPYVIASAGLRISVASLAVHRMVSMNILTICPVLSGIHRFLSHTSHCPEFDTYLIFLPCMACRRSAFPASEFGKSSRSGQPIVACVGSFLHSSNCSSLTSEK